MNNINENVLQRYDCDGVELIINTQTGESFATIRGYARMSNKTHQTISARVANQVESEDAQILTAGGLQGVKLINGKTVIKWLVKDNPELLAVISELGWNVYCHKLAGFEVKSTAIKPLSPAEMFLYSAQQLVELEKKQAELEKAIVTVNTEVKELEQLCHQHDCEIDRIFNPNGHYFSVMGYARLKGVPIAIKQASVLGRKASKICKEKGIKVEKLNDPRFGLVNSYPENILDLIFN